MKFLKITLLLLLFLEGIYAQSLFKEKKLAHDITSFSNYNYQIYLGTDKGVFYYHMKAVPMKGAPLLKVSPLGNEAFFVGNGKLHKFNTSTFKILDVEKIDIKDVVWTSIESNNEGSRYFLNDSNGKLYSFNANDKKLAVTPIPIDFFVSQMSWHNNLNKLLLVDDLYLQYFDPMQNKFDARIKLNSLITAVHVNEKEFKVLVGLTNGKLVVLDQGLSKVIHETRISNTAITSVLADPLDHYLYIGDADGVLYTYDLLKKEVLSTKKTHHKNLKSAIVFDPVKAKKFILTTGLDKKMKIHTITDLIPNYDRIVSEKLTIEKEYFLKVRKGESAVAYDTRVSGSNLKKLFENSRTRLYDSIAATKLESKPSFNMENDSLGFNIQPFPLVKVKLFQKIKDFNSLHVSDVHYMLKSDNSFAIKSFEIESPLGDRIKYSSDKEEMRAYEEEVSIALSKEIAKKEVEFKNSLETVVTDLRADGKLNDVALSVDSVLKKEKNDLGEDELNLHVTFLSQGVKAKIERETADYQSGKYDIFDSEAATTLVGFFIKSCGEKLKDYLTNDRKITFKITGATDKSQIGNALPYKDEYGVFRNFPYYFQNQLSGLTLNKETGIKENSQLGFLRTYAVRNFIENYSDVFEATKRKYIHYSEEADDYGPEYRKIKIEVVIHKVANAKATDTRVANKTDTPLSPVDVNIPQGVKTDGYALVIGNEDYASFQRNINKESNVPFAIRDAEVFKNYLHTMYGMPLENIDFLQNATFGEMSQAISRLERLMELDGENKDIVIYYSGHGMPEEQSKKPYLIPVDINGNNVSQGVDLKGFMKRLNDKPHGKISLIIDACFSGLGKNKPLVGLKGITIKPINPELGDNMILLSSSSGNESSVVDAQNMHGLFTYHLLEVLKDAKGVISIQDLYNVLRKKVGISAIKKLDKKQTPSVLIGKNIQEHIQTMQLIGG